MDTSSSVSIWVSIGVTGKQLKGKSEDCLKIAGRLLKIEYEYTSVIHWIYNKLCITEE